MVKIAVGVLATSCTTAEQKARNALAGNYRYEVTGQGYMVTKSLTLRTDGTATMSVNGDVGGTPMAGTLTGIFDVDGSTLKARFKDEGTFAFQIKGDSLLPDDSGPDMALAVSAGVPDSARGRGVLCGCCSARAVQRGGTRIES